MFFDHLEADKPETAEAIDFEPKSTTESLEFSPEEALQLFENYGLNANEHLEKTTVEDYQWGTKHSTLFDTLDQP